MAQVIHFQLRGGADAEFTHAIRRIHEAIQKTNWPANYIWYSLVNGGEPE
jgi:hypothetical protein